ncbi:DNA cytosine methyltransferase [Burkholderia pseudomallei]|uniref:DNA (cytosine-5-)-methyltransferase n=1 Tax=Burkholderia pseudomallei TaxID=28450 RepID=A0AAX0U086_BURPE|nr:DNA cytosine methyltransferase [Burkholderia pseudomallei]AUL57462.1 DNA (cytosine-5-)-methyltransferase [Burkholderia pseudomallei]EES25708.1 modification methylase HgiDII [Burkholderia pseudomallei 1106b]MBF3684144.1 DNA cytosine methyltransferase [Burkholderia pseudomallei]MBF3825487.1 DNA cytosine methyltransferase [Burkholderia pseudomallei]MBF3942732.1 DNA cytosine methyltransferase [Burkholderia pseudomallei]
MRRFEVANISCVDLFCGAGGLTHGFVLEDLPVVAGIDLDPACRYPYEANNRAKFVERDVSTVTTEELETLFGDAELTILAGCAPCQPFSSYAQRYELDGEDGKWGLLYEFARLAQGTEPDVITMENVPTVAKHAVFHDFVDTLTRLGYKVWFDVVDSSRYGVPQMRRRMVLLASKHGDIEMIEPTHKTPKTVRQAIGRLRSLSAGEAAPRDKLHVASTLSEKNLQRIKVSKPGGTWRDWPEDLIAECHRAESGRTYPGVYGRMEWDKPAPTMTTQCYGFGNGRFGHPEQDRAISLREAAILQSFPRDYAFVPKDGEVSFTVLGRLIGNAVPVNLGRAIARSIKEHLASI